MNVKHLILSIIVFVACLLATDVSAATISVPPKFISGTGLSRGLVGYWTFDGKDVPNGRANDVSGNGNHGTLSGIATSTFYIPGKIGQAFKFDGVNDYIDAGSAASVDNIQDQGGGGMTIVGWMRPNTTGANSEVIMAKGLGTSFSGFWQFALSVGNRLIFIKEGGTDMTARTSINTFTTGVWQQVALTWDGSTTAANVLFYVNGVVKNHDLNGDGATFATDASVSVGIGGETNGTNIFDGNLDDVRLYNRVLSAAEIKHLYNIGVATRQADSPPVTATSSCSTGLSCGLVGYWTFDGKDVPNGRASDLSGSGYHGTLTSIATSTFYVPGKIGQGFKFDGTDDYVNVGNVGEIKTLSYWINTNSNKFNAIPYAGDTFYKDGVNAGSLLGSEKVTNGTFAANVSGWTVNGVSTLGWVNDTSGDGSTGYARFTIDNNSSFNRFSRDISTTANTTYLLSFWYRTSGITGNMAVYFSADESTLSNSVRSNSLIPSTSWRYYSVIVNTSALSFPDISITKLGSVGSGTFDIDAISVKQLTNTIGTGWHHVVTTSSNAIYASLMSMGRFQDSSGFMTGSLDDVRTYNRVLTATEVKQLYNIGAATKVASSPTVTATSSCSTGLSCGLVGYWTFDGKDTPWTSATAATTLDKSGNGGTGTLTAMSQSATPSPGTVGQSLKFRGNVGEYVQIADADRYSFGNGTTDTPFSLSAWVYYDTIPAGFTLWPIISKWTGIGDAEWSFYTSSTNITGSGSANAVTLQINTSGGTTNRLILEGRTALTPGKWHHVIATYDGSSTSAGMKLYLNATQETTDALANGTYVAMSNLAATVDIGGSIRTNATFDAFAKGKMDDVRIYNRALSAAEVRQLYNLGR